MMVSTCCLLLLMLIATVTDIWRHKIYNWTTYTGIVVAILLSLLATLGRADFTSIGVGKSLLGLLTCGLVMLVCFVLFRVGGGDVKLLAMAGAFLGPELGLEALLWTFVLGGATGLILLAWKLGVVVFLGRIWRQLNWKLNFGSWQPLTANEQVHLQMPLFLAPSALVAVFIVQFSLVESLI